MPGQTQRNFTRAARRIEAIYAATGQNMVSGIRMIAEEIMTDVKASRPGAGVPVYTGTDHVGGTLRSSGTVTGPVGPKHEVTLSFGGASAPYALRQHEELYWHHNLGEARYLVRGLERWRANGVSVQRALREMTAAIRNPTRAAGGGTP